MIDDEIQLATLAMFELGDLGDRVALVLRYAATQEKLFKDEIEGLAIGLTKQKAMELGRALLEFASKTTSATAPRGKTVREG
jgi:hypothetical protein